MTEKKKGETSSLDERLAEIEQRRAAIARQREAAQEARALERRVADAEAMLEIEEAVIDAERDHGALNDRIAVVYARRADESIAGAIIVKRPAGAYYRRHMTTDHDTPKKVDEASQRMLQHCRVWPDVDRMEALLAELPATIPKALRAIDVLAGGKADESAGK